MVAQTVYKVNMCNLVTVLYQVTEELLQLRLVTSCLQLIQDLCKTLLAHLGEGLRRQLTVWSRAASFDSGAAADWPRWIPQW